MNSNLIIVDPYPRPTNLIFSKHDIGRLERLGQVIYHEGSRASDALIERSISRAIAVIGQTRLDKDRLDRASLLRFIANVDSNFLPNIDYVECHKRGIHVVSTAPVFAEAVAEMALALALASICGVHRGDCQIRSGTEVLYDEDNNASSFLLKGKPIGIVGFGNLGRALLPLIRSFGGRIFVHDPWICPTILQDQGVEPVDASTIFRQSQVLFIMAAMTTENNGELEKRILT